jgi:glycosyltransferase involved in cell wall biosynthesis
MSPKPAVVIFFNDWKVYPDGVNAGGGESATIALGRAIAKLGHRVIACANLPNGETSVAGIEFWNIGACYSVHLVTKRLAQIGPFHCICATLIHPLLQVRELENCLSKIVINHAPSPFASGLEPDTVLNIVDYMLCVSEAQRELILRRAPGGANIAVVRNGFDPEIFTYAGPEHRDWDQLVFVGRLEPAKGIHLLLEAFGDLKREFPTLKLAVFGDENYWPQLLERKQELLKSMPGLSLHGKVPQRQLAECLRRAGLLVFPSISFETAGLAVVDAQASGCPVLATGVGGVPEYLVDGVLGQVMYENTAQGFRDSIAALLRDRSRLERYSRAGERYGHERPWSVVAAEVLEYAQRAARRGEQGTLAPLPVKISSIINCCDVQPTTVLEAHQEATSTAIYSDADLEKATTLLADEAWPHLLRGLRLEERGSLNEAIESYKLAARRAVKADWQPFLRLALIYAETREMSQAASCAREVLERAPDFPLKPNLEKLIELARIPV